MVIRFCPQHRSHFCPCVRRHLYRPPFTKTDRLREAQAEWDENPRRRRVQTNSSPARRRRAPEDSQPSLWDGNSPIGARTTEED
jgi:hypothetical protein